MKRPKNNIGIFIALMIIFSWALLLIALLNLNVSYRDPIVYVYVLLQMHLYTGLFITAHDAMHGVVAGNKNLNKIIGSVAAILFAFNFYPNLIRKHHEHHRYVGTEKDPDYHNGSFFIWYYSFLKQYITWYQIALMAITYNLLIMAFPKENVILFWIIPSLLSTLQLFYFGTYLPHRGEHEVHNIHKSRSLRRNHILAFLSCYFFGYHYEHHESPSTPWWQLYKEKNNG